MSLLRLFPLIFAQLLTAWAVRAQVFIPDPNERAWLNELIPGIVDAGGIMDTTHAGIADVDSAALVLNTTLASLNLVGIQYLSHLERWTFAFGPQAVGMQTPLPITVNGLPASLRRLAMASDIPQDVDLHLPALPQQMDWITISGSSNREWVDIVSLPDQLGWMTLAHVDSLSWTGSCHVGWLEYTGDPFTPQDLMIPAISLDILDIRDMAMNMLDISEVLATNVRIRSCDIPGTLLWSQSTEYIEFSFSSIPGILPPFPSTLTELNIDGAIISCLPLLPESLSLLFDHMAMITCFPNWPSGMHYAGGGPEPPTAETATYCSVLNSDCPGAYPDIAGRVFRDLDVDGQYDAGEPGLPQASVTLQPNGNVVGCQADGSWEIGVLPGAYSIAASTSYPYIQNIAPATHTADVPDLGDADTGNDFAVTLLPGINDLRAFLTASVARPGFDNRLFLSCNNYGTEPINTTLTLEFDPAQSWLGSSIAPTSLNSHSASWDLGTMAIGATTNLSVDLHTDASIPLGTPIAHVLTASPVATDETPLDNVYTFTDSVVGSYDPNDKLLSPAVLPPSEVAAGTTPIAYTIRFQNTGTYMAERVVILDTLSEDLQWSTMRFIASSHAHEWYIRDGVLHVVHSGINLPDSTSNEPASHGFFTFSMLPGTHLQDGDQIVNIAHIVFDLNTPIVTPPAVFHVDIAAGVHEHAATGPQVIPNPAKDRIRLQGHTDRTTYRMRDISGRTVLQGQLDGSGTIDVGALPSGLYLIETASTHSTGTVRFVKE